MKNSLAEKSAITTRSLLVKAECPPSADGSGVLRILIFPGGTEIGLEIQRALHRCKDIRLYSAGLDVSNHAPYVFSRHHSVPSIYENGWIERLNEIIDANEIDYVFPAYDDVIVALAQNSNRIHSRIVSSPVRTCLITRSKTTTYELFLGTVPVPTVWRDASMVTELPVFVKPDKGQGSKHTQLVSTNRQLQELLNGDNQLIATEHLPGDEYTVDCFSDRDRGLLFCSGRQRIRTKDGISMNSRSVQNEVFIRYAHAITNKLSLYGAWFFQLKTAKDGTLKLLEVGPRIAGTMCLHRVQGINLPLLSIYEQERFPLEIMRNAVSVEVDRALVNRYKHNVQFSTVYVDLDDTLIVNGYVNTDLTKFLYQCVNARKRLVLLTKHSFDVNDTLKQHRLSGLFDELIHVKRSEHKSDYIYEKDAILIDDSFSERKLVSEKLAILTFDCSMIEMLLDDTV